MKKKRPSYLSDPKDIKKVSKKEILKSLEKVDEENKAYRRSLRTDAIAMSAQVGGYVPDLTPIHKDK